MVWLLWHGHSFQAGQTAQERKPPRNPFKAHLCGFLSSAVLPLSGWTRRGAVRAEANGEEIEEADDGAQALGLSEVAEKEAARGRCGVVVTTVCFCQPVAA